MPTRAPSICTYPGCNAKVRPGPRCEAHAYHKPGKVERQARREKERARMLQRTQDKMDAYHFYNSRRWRKLAKWFLNANPLCDECKKERRMRAAVVVDHKIPISQGGSEWDVENLQSLCKSHHTAKSNAERRISG